MYSGKFKVIIILCALTILILFVVNIVHDNYKEYSTSMEEVKQDREVIVVDGADNDHGSIMSILNHPIFKKIVIHSGATGKLIHPCVTIEQRRNILDCIDKHYIRNVTSGVIEWISCGRDCKERNSFKRKIVSYPRPELFEADTIIYKTELCDKIVSSEETTDELIDLVNSAIRASEMYYNNLIKEINQSSPMGEKVIYKKYIKYKNHIIYDLNEDGKLDIVIGVCLGSNSSGYDEDYSVLVFAYGGGDIFIIQGLVPGDVEPIGIVDISDNGGVRVVLEGIIPHQAWFEKYYLLIEGSDPRIVVGKSIPEVLEVR